MGEHFGDLLNEYAQRTGFGADRLAQLAGLPKQTVASWLGGRVRQPRQWQPVVRVAAVLRLNEREANRLLGAAGWPSLAELRTGALQNGEPDELALFLHWQQAPSPPDQPSRSGPSPFQAPPRLDELFGRQALSAAVGQQLLKPGSICVLQGMGGVGKSALAIQLAYRLQRHFADGILWADLTGVRADDGYAGAVTGALINQFTAAYGRDVSGVVDLTARSAVLREVLANKQALLVLDNAHSADDVQPLLPPSTGACSVLITTRNRRLLQGQATAFEVHPLEEAAGLALLIHLLGEQRIHAEADAAQGIIAQLGGLPLALKIVAADLATADGLTLREYSTLLQDEQARLEPLDDWPEVGKNVRASFALSFVHLPAGLQRLFRLLWHFPGSDFGVEAAAALADLPLVQARQQLGRLYTLSLVERSRRPTSPAAEPGNLTGVVEQPARYRLHPLLRTFAQEQFLAAGLPVAPIAQRAARFYAGFAAGNSQAYERLAQDYENIVGALRWAAHADEWTTFLSGLAGLTAVHLGVAGFLDAAGHWQEAQELLALALHSETASSDPLLLAQLHFRQGVFAFRKADATRAANLLRQSQSLLESLPPTDETKVWLARICELMAQLIFQQNQGEWEAAVHWSLRGIELLRTVESPTARQEEGYLQIRRAAILARCGQLDAARQVTIAGLGLLPSTPSAARISGLTNLGIIYAIWGQSAPAIEAWRQAIEDAQALGDNRRLADLYSNIGAAETRQGRFGAAIVEKNAALDLYRRLGDPVGETRIQLNLAEDHLFLQEWEPARSQLALALNSARSHGLKDLELSTLINGAQLELHEQQLAAAEATLQAAAGLSPTQASPEQQAELLRLAAELAYARTQWLTALGLANRARKLTGDAREVAIIWRLCGEILSLAQKRRWAEAALAHSATLAEPLSLFELARTRVAQARHHLAYEEREEAVAYLTEAIQHFRQLQNEAYVRSVEALLDNTDRQ
jgi:tetratricopeptide (TPR) repeat protein